VAGLAFAGGIKHGHRFHFVLLSEGCLRGEAKRYDVDHKPGVTEKSRDYIPQGAALLLHDWKC
jgi:hypothetical protein